MAFIINTSKITKTKSYSRPTTKKAFKKGGRYGYYQEGGEVMEEEMMMEDPAMTGAPAPAEGMEMEEGGTPMEEGNPQDTIQQMQTLLSELIGDPGLEELAQMAEGNPTLQNMMQVIAMLSTVMNVTPSETEATEETMPAEEGEDMPMDMEDMDIPEDDDTEDMEEMMS